MKNPTISVVMSVYNGEPYLTQAVESILCQSFEDFEFIIIEDKSTDDSLKILQKYSEQDDRIILIKKDNNKGVAGFIENLNLGLKIARGKYIARMDADDVSDVDRFKKQVNYLEQHPEIFMVGSSLHCIDGEGVLLNTIDAPLTNTAIYKRMLKNISMFHPVIMFRNEKQFYYREKLHYCEDYDLYLRLMSEGYKFANIREPLLKYRILPDSISRKDSRFVRYLFVEKARVFYRQRKQFGKDSYIELCSKKLSTILQYENKDTVKDLRYAATVALKYKFKKELRITADKLTKEYPSNFSSFIYKGCSKYHLMTSIGRLLLRITN